MDCVTVACADANESGLDVSFRMFGQLDDSLGLRDEDEVSRITSLIFPLLCLCKAAGDVV